MPSKRPPVVAQSGLPTHARFMDKKERSQAPARRSETTSRPQCSRVPYQRTTEPSREPRPAQSPSSRRRARRAILRAQRPKFSERTNTHLLAVAEAAASEAEERLRRQPHNTRLNQAADRARAAARAAAKAARALLLHPAPNRSCAASWDGSPRRDATAADPRTREAAGPGAASGLFFTHVDRVRSRLQAWLDIGAPRRVLSWLRDGVHIQWNGRGPPAPFHHGVSSFTPAERAWLTLERDRCLTTGAWVRASDRTHVSRAFVTYHRGKPRLVIDLRFINLHTRKCACVFFEPLSSLRRMCRKGDWMCSLDLADAYHHVPFHASALRYFTFAIETLSSDGTPRVEYFSTPVLNFGWTNSPFYFTEVMKAVARIPLPPEIMLRVLADTTTTAHTANAEHLRARYALLLTYLFMGRQDSCISLLRADHGITDDYLWLRITEKMKRGWAFRRIVRIPRVTAPACSHASVVDTVASVGQAFVAARDALPHAAKCTHFFQLPGERPPRTADMSTWLAKTLQDLDVRAPPGFAYLGHSLRSGASSAAEAIRVSKYKGNWLGGWSQTGRTRELHYIDPSFQPTPASYAFFGWLLEGQYRAEHPEWQPRRGAADDDEPGEL